MKTIHKYNLAIIDTQNVRMPKGSRILCAQVQLSELCIWAIVDTSEKCIDIKTIRIIGTGNPAPDAFWLSYISTVQMQDGALVWHVFEQP